MNYIPISFLALLFCFASCKNINSDQTVAQASMSAASKKFNGSTSEISTFMTFQNSDAEEAMNFYMSLFDNSEVKEIVRYEEGGPAPAGTIMYAKFTLNGKAYMCSDSPIKHAWDFTPGVSHFVECQSEEELMNLFEKLSEEGSVLMPLGNYGFSQKFAFVEDRFGVSWQLNLD